MQKKYDRQDKPSATKRRENEKSFGCCVFGVVK